MKVDVELLMKKVHLFILDFLIFGKVHFFFDHCWFPCFFYLVSYGLLFIIFFFLGFTELFFDYNIFHGVPNFSRRHSNQAIQNMLGNFIHEKKRKNNIK